MFNLLTTIKLAYLKNKFHEAMLGMEQVYNNSLAYSYVGRVHDLVEDQIKAEKKLKEVIEKISRVTGFKGEGLELYLEVM